MNQCCLFLAPTRSSGSHSVCRCQSSSCLLAESQLSLNCLSAVSQQSLGSFSAVSQQSLSSLSALSQHSLSSLSAVPQLSLSYLVILSEHKILRLVQKDPSQYMYNDSELLLINAPVDVTPPYVDQLPPDPGQHQWGLQILTS